MLKGVLRLNIEAIGMDDRAHRVLQPQSLDTTMGLYVRPPCYQLIGPIRMPLTAIHERESNHDVETGGMSRFRSLRADLRFIAKVYAGFRVRLRPLAPVCLTSTSAGNRLQRRHPYLACICVGETL